MARPPPGPQVPRWVEARGSERARRLPEMPRGGPPAVRENGKRCGGGVGGGRASAATPPRSGPAPHPARHLPDARILARRPPPSTTPPLHPAPGVPGRGPGKRLRPGLGPQPTGRGRGRSASFPVAGGLPGAPRAAAGTVKGPSARLSGPQAAKAPAESAERMQPAGKARRAPRRERRAQHGGRGRAAGEGSADRRASTTWSRGSRGCGGGGGGDGRRSGARSRHNRLLRLTGNLGRRSRARGRQGAAGTARRPAPGGGPKPRSGAGAGAGAGSGRAPAGRTAAGRGLGLRCPSLPGGEGEPLSRPRELSRRAKRGFEAAPAPSGGGDKALGGHGTPDSPGLHSGCVFLTRVVTVCFIREVAAFTLQRERERSWRHLLAAGIPGYLLLSVLGGNSPSSNALLRS